MRGIATRSEERNLVVERIRNTRFLAYARNDNTDQILPLIELNGIQFAFKFIYYSLQDNISDEKCDGFVVWIANR
jgi:hypothetical protein